MATSNKHENIDIHAKATLDLTQLSDILQLGFSFEKLQVVLEILIKQQKVHSGHLETIYDLLGSKTG